ncbi:MAG: hypothetical protein A2W93_06350 [Bacteroidetes bacterium GWF2_43_63]|nr:MAG: hypothetical protein A2W94_08185 [Bacteroidetes bacterium GWE2_42_42]OFY53241.1 MAG: hypothetical protein A2W93_06350 [Bacteroidetes bacterium GWF2_43_63]HBG71767.1 peptidase M17 [Bacteroidales bacterium]HCB61568.1 peptidase M17 [Bacteroidales bacterium]HCY22780.1 peptidase M17 [Bacteroidales bacterium]
MEVKIGLYRRRTVVGTTVYLTDSPESLPAGLFSKEEKAYMKTRLRKDKAKIVYFNRLPNLDIVAFIPEKIKQESDLEKLRRLGNDVVKITNKEKIQEISLDVYLEEQALTQYFLEGMLLGNYEFLKYKTNNEPKKHLNSILIRQTMVEHVHIFELMRMHNAVSFARDLVNEIPSALTSVSFPKQIASFLKDVPVKVEVLSKQKITALKMGGLLGVNRGSVDEPTFTILEYKPKKHVNKKPFILVGKGVMYDTGGLNLKPGASMADMKCDMSGGAAVAGALQLIASMQLPVYVVGLIPATDNRPGGNAYAPGDVLTMMNGKTVEIQNTDAEGRLILADALAYAQKYDPAVVIDIATLTGAAHAAIGHYAIVGMESGASGYFERLHAAAEEVFERIVEFPFWDEYAEQLKSSVADMANIGGKYAGAITAGKFLEKFTDYPYIHLDIAGPAFMESAWNYWPQGGTGVGVRLFYQFLKDEAERKR